MRAWPQVDRIISQADAEEEYGGVQYLVKWRGLDYAEATWEYGSALESEADQVWK